MSSRPFQQGKLLWTPPQTAPFASVEVLRRAINRKHGLNLKNYFDLYEYSVNNDTFWSDIWQDLGIVYSVPPEQPKKSGPLEHLHQVSWFPGARLNYAENLLRRNDDAIACTTIDEAYVATDYTYKQLRGLVADMAAALRVNGLNTGDRVAAVISNSITAIALMLATTSIGAIYTGTAPDMGAKGILDRYTQVRPKFIFIETETTYAGARRNLDAKVAEVAAGLSYSGLRTAVLLPSRVTGKPSSLKVPNSMTLDKFLSTGDGRPLVFEQLPFSHPLVILYSSGTSGAPKCIVHSAGGLLLQVKKDLVYGFDIRPNDTFFQFTTTGWMMWMLMIGALSIGARTIAYDGSPFYPSVPAFLRMVDEQMVSVLGLSPRFMAELQGKSILPASVGKFEALHSIAVGGAIFTPPLHEWTQNAFNQGKNGTPIRVFVGIGATDVCAAYGSSVKSLPIYAGEISCKVLGMKIEVFDPQGKNIEHTGQAGEMVVTRPHPSVPLGFWDADSQKPVPGPKFEQAYFDMYPSVWRQGDFMVTNPKTNGYLVLGRSDGVLNPKGIRFGSGEIYSILESSFGSLIEESICVGQRRPQDSDETVLLFLKMRKSGSLNDELIRQIKGAIRNGLSPRHCPDHIFEVSQIPMTTNGKKIEIAVKQIVSGQNPKPSGAVANPEAFKEYVKYFTMAKAKL
ncbi:acetoacetate-CoA ligase [Dendrothele bispora CBS 962.96]|uniref:Acetoacetate-CoA ligase n=1 Tax=Dendrothele bispora (strain CBS 962.96) TaxID=1314807 RepID=A0A4S8MPY1_DENBC|nr:acetoacetate-CoA ligase [Dendrothele bispora CBS 962.96]